MSTRAAEFGNAWSADYDLLYALPQEHTDATVDALERLAAGGPVLEVGAGTGRVALALAARGLRVRATDASPAMVAEMRRRPGGDLLDLAVEVMPEVSGGPYAMVAILINTIWALTDIDAQAALFASVARVLAPGGCFVVESAVPNERTYNHLRIVKTDGTRMMVQERTHLPGVGLLQLDEHVCSPSGIELRPLLVRPTTMGELDLMARLAGLRLRARWADWSGTPLGPEDRSPISIFERADAPERVIDLA